MKIIKQGKPPESRVYQDVCGRCGAVFEFERKEAELVFDPREGGFLRYRCPCCDVLMTRDAK